MNKSVLIGTVLGVALATAGGVWAGYELLDEQDGQATGSTLECFDEVVTETQDPKDPNRIAGKVIGGLVGGTIVGKVATGEDDEIAAAAGAAGGAYAGDRIQKKMQENNKTTTTTRRRCVEKS